MSVLVCQGLEVFVSTGVSGTEGVCIGVSGTESVC